MSPHKRAQRLRSRTAYRDLSKTEAIAAASKQPSIADPMWPPPALGQGQRITRFLSANSAIVNGSGGRGLALSTTPLAVDDEHGHKVPVDVALTDQGSSYRPARAAVPISIAKAIGDGATLGPIGVSLAGAAPKASPSLVGGKVYYANTTTDTDYFVAPLPDAIEAGWVLRSPAAPEYETLSFKLPAGAQLEASDEIPNAVEIRQDGSLLATIPPPSAWDADGIPVNVSDSVSGNQLRVHVAHQSADVRYPIEVDPLVGMVFGNGPNGNPGTFPGWGFNWVDAWGVPLRPGTTTVPQTVDLYPGNNYAAGAEGWWQFDAAGTSYIYEWDLYRYHHVEGTGQSWAIIGIYNHLDGDKSSSTGNWYADGNQPPNGGQPEGDQGDFFGWARRICTTGYTTNGGPCPAWSNRTNNNVRLKLQLAAQICCLASDGEYTSVWGSTLLIGDNAAPPAPKMPTLPTGWVQSLTSVDVTATQPGAGVSRVNVAIPDAGSNDGKNLPCASYTAAPYNSTQGPAYSPCPENPPPQTVAISKTVPDGIHAVNASAVSATGLTGPTTSQNVKIDRTPPTISDTGALRQAQDGEVGDGDYDLNASASDAGSGVASLEIDVDGQQVLSKTQSCGGGGCPLSLPTWTFHSDHYAAGPHQISVLAKDQVNNPATDTWTVEGTRTATAPIGPGEVNLSTGSFSLTRTDAAVDASGEGLALARTYNSREVSAPQSVMFGPGWQSSLPDAGPTADYTGLIENADGKGGVELQTSDGSDLLFKSGKSGLSAPRGYEDLTLTAKSKSIYSLTDLDGNYVELTKPSGAANFVSTQVHEAGSGTTSTFSYDLVNGSPRLSRAVAPPPSGVDCSTLVRGCRALDFSYAQSNTATGTDASSWGAYAGRLDHVDLTAYDPNSSSMTTTTVADYQYDSNGRLRAAWDPRISPALKETYDYDSDGHLTSITPAGEAAWTFGYGTISGDSNPGRLKTVSRETPQGTATETVAYHVPISGSAAPVQMSASDVSAWGQRDDPIDATAIFPPDEVPGSDPPSDYRRADIHYVDGQGHEVNLETPGGDVTTTEYESTHNNVVRTLTAANRDRALGAGSSSASEAAQLDTQLTYDPTGTELTDKLGPQHSVQLSSGQSASARQHTHTDYDQGAPSGGPYELPTTVSEGAQVSGQSGDSDVRVTKYSYDGQNGLGWQLRQPTSQTVDAVSGGLNLTTTTLYDSASGQVTETRQPANPNGGDAHATETIYYSAGANSTDASCGNRPEWATLPCKTTPAAQPTGSGLPPLPVSTYTYNVLDEVVSESDTAGIATRSTTTGYDGAGRVTSRAIDSSEGMSVPTVTTSYDPSTGRLATTSDGTRTISRSYDSLGRMTIYGDADGNTSTTSYDIDGRPVTTNDGKGSQNFSYDPTTGLLTQLDDSAAGTLTATYDADGQLLTQTLPNGLQERKTYDETGQLSHLSYVKTSNCAVACTWLDFGGSRSIHDQWLTLTGSQGTQDYSYDGAGRLTQAKDTPTGKGCTVRDYAYDADSNRFSQTTHAPAVDTSCDPTSAGTTVGHQYDAADRLIDSAATYDDFGRTTSLPGQDAGGGTLTNTYYANDLTASASQDGVTKTYDRDPSGRLRSIDTQQTTTTTSVLHYSDDSDATAWETTDDEVTYTRNVTGIDGDLTAIDDSSSGIRFELQNLHGDLVAEASSDPLATGLLTTSLSSSDEFGVPDGSAPPSTYSWLGAKRRRTELASGVIEMGVREYVPALGRFAQTDPVAGGSANAYDYANQDSCNQTDLTGARPQEPVYPLQSCAGRYESAFRYLDGAIQIRKKGRVLQWGFHLNANGQKRFPAGLTVSGAITVNGRPRHPYRPHPHFHDTWHAVIHNVPRGSIVEIVLHGVNQAAPDDQIIFHLGCIAH